MNPQQQQQQPQQQPVYNNNNNNNYAPQQQQQQPYYGQAVPPQQAQPYPPQQQQPYYGGGQPQYQQPPMNHQQQQHQNHQQQNTTTRNSTTTPNSTTTTQSNSLQARGRMMRPPFVDPATNIIYDTDNPEYEGWLTKQSMWLKVRATRAQERCESFNGRTDILCVFAYNTTCQTSSILTRSRRLPCQNIMCIYLYIYLSSSSFGSRFCWHRNGGAATASSRAASCFLARTSFRPRTTWWTWPRAPRSSRPI